MTLTLRQARNFVLHQQLLTSHFKAKGKDAVLQVMEQISYAQIDTISVIERAHHHVISSRVVDYQKQYLQELVETDRLVFEYWAHAAAYLPMKDYRFSLVRKTQIQSGQGHWFKRHPKNMKRVLERFKTDGPLMARDFKKDALKTDIPWMQHPTNQAIRQLYMEGTIMVSHRKGFQKVYDLPENILPSNVDQRMPSRTEYIEHLIERDLQAHGVMKVRDIGHLLTNIRTDVQKIVDQKIKEGILIAIKIQGLDNEIYYANKTQVQHFLNQKSLKKSLKILSPFDNLLIQRKRMKELFDFDYTIECYVTAAKRKVGYFSLPLLWGNQFVGQIDLKADRKTKILWIKNLVWEDSFQQVEQLQPILQKALKLFTDFNHCERIELSPDLAKRFPNLL